MQRPLSYFHPVQTYILLELLNTKFDKSLEVAPADTLILVSPPPPDGTDNITDPLLYPMLIIPLPTKIKLLASAVPDETDDVVLDDI